MEEVKETTPTEAIGGTVDSGHEAKAETLVEAPTGAVRRSVRKMRVLIQPRTRAGLAAIGFAVLALAHAATAQSLSTTAAAAREFAAQLAAAGEEEAKVRVLLDICRWLNIGVYTGDLKPLVKGAERGVMDFYLYDFEVRTLARTLHQGYRWSALGIHAVLVENSLLPVTFPRTFFFDDLVRGMRDALESPDEPQSAAALLVYELAKRHDPPWDFVEGFRVEQPQLDALQHFLILADILLPMTLRTRPPAAPNEKRALATRVALAAYDETCPVFTDAEAAAAGWKLGKWLNRLNPNLAAKRAMQLEEVLRQGVHGALLAYTFNARRASPELQSTHYWHGDIPGHPIDFRLQIEILDQWPERVRCGLLADHPLPHAGNRPEDIREELKKNMKVLWTEAPGDSLRDHGALRCDRALPSIPGLNLDVLLSTVGACVTNTDAEGIATLRFLPNHEEEPNLGLEKEARGALWGSALYQTYFGNWVTGAVPQILFPKGDVFAWMVGWHDPSVYRGSIGIEFLGRWDFERTGPDPESGVRATVTDSVSVTTSYHANLNVKKVAVFGNRAQVETEYSAVGQISDVYKSNTKGTRYCPGTQSFQAFTYDVAGNAVAAGSKKGVTSPLDFIDDDVSLEFRPDGSYVLRIPIPKITLEGHTESSSLLVSDCPQYGTRSASASEPYPARPLTFSHFGTVDPNLPIVGSRGIEVTGRAQPGEELSGSVDVRVMAVGHDNPTEGSLKIRWKIKPNQE